MKKNKSYIYIAFIIVITIGIYFTFIRIEKIPPSVSTIAKEQIIVQKDAVIKNTVTLTVQNKTYDINIKEGSTVYDAMNTLKNMEGSNFNFHSKEYSSLGNFVDEINGIKGIPGKYWIYYINGKEASIGISKYVLKSGDIISWKQE